MDEKELNNDIKYEETDLDDSVVTEENAVETVKKLKEKLKKALAEKQEYLTGWQKAKADFINARKKDEESQKEFIKYSNEAIISELISTIDSFNMAFANKEAWEKVDKNWRNGVEYIYSQFFKTLEGYGLKEVNPINEKFDPMRDEATAYEPVTDESKDHMIIEVVQKGYSLNGKMLKAPKVKVGEFKK